MKCVLFLAVNKFQRFQHSTSKVTNCSRYRYLYTHGRRNVIKSGGIWYKKADIQEVSVNIIDNTAILLNRITLLAVVGGNEVTNPFEVTEVYVKQNGIWKLGSLSFTKLLVRGGE